MKRTNQYFWEALRSWKPVVLLCIVTSLLSAEAPAQTKIDQTGDDWAERETDWNGFTQKHFNVGDQKAYLVVPKSPLPGTPWVWRARFPNYHSEIDVRLLEEGFHIGYVDVAGLFGGPKAMEIGDQFYQFLVEERGLSPQVCLEGVSRGGLLVYNWAARHPTRVACIYCDTPVCDFKSWPAGLGQGRGAPKAWETCLAAYGLTQDEALQYSKNPIDSCAAIARAKVPCLHIVSENDQIVPPVENTYLVRDKFAEAGHEMKVISVAEGTERSGGHHFDHPAIEQVVKFFVESIQPLEGER